VRAREGGWGRDGGWGVVGLVSSMWLGVWRVGSVLRWKNLRELGRVYASTAVFGIRAIL